MDNIKRLYNRIYTPLVCETGRVFFYTALLFEIMIFLLDRADWHNPYQSMMFRVTFVLFVVKCVCTRYTPREMAFIVVCAAFCILAYSISIKDEIIRAMVFVIAMKDIDVRRALKFDYLFMLAGIIVLGFLSVFGIMGSVVASPGYADKSDAFMVCFGLGSSNTLAIQIWVLTALGIYLYHTRLDGYGFALIACMGAAVYLCTRCRIAAIMIVFSALFGYLFKRFPGLSSSIGVYIAGVVLTLAGVGFSVYAAAISKWHDEQSEFEILLNRITTGRIMSIYPFDNGGGVLSNWRLFAAPDFDRFFDMGLVRLFWWYGIIPGSLAIVAVIILYIWQYKNRDGQGFLLTLSVMLFSVLEAHFVSVFIARAYVLFLIGGAWYKMLDTKRRMNQTNKSTLNGDADEKYHIAFYIGSLNKGGAERVFVNLAGYFALIGYKVTMITQYVYDNEYELPAGVCRVVSDLTKEETGGRIYNFFARIVKLHRIIRNTGADLLMTTIGKANFMAITCATFLPTRVVVSVVADPALEYPTRLMRLLLQTLFGEADGIIMQTEMQRRFLRRGLQREAVILPNSVSGQFVRERFMGERKKEIYMVGRMDENKNQAMAIRAFARAIKDHADYRLVLCGDGPLKDDLVRLSIELGIEDHVTFAGIVSDVPDRLYDAYAFVLTSDTEGMPNTLLEAMSLGVPCISTDCPCGGPAQLIKDKVNGILVGVGDIDALAGAMSDIMDDPEYAKTLSVNAYTSMFSYRPDTVNALWNDYFVNIINR